jgi:hypothetical protein
MSLHARLGPEVGIRTAVDDCYPRAADDPRPDIMIAEESAA